MEPDPRRAAAAEVASEVEVSVTSDEWRRVRDAAGLCREAVRATLRHLGAADRSAEVSVLLTDDETVRGLNHSYRHKDKATNVLSFPGHEDGLAACRGMAGGRPVILGDVILAAGVLVAEAEAQAKPLSNHLRHLVVHGVLHLLGFDHESDTDAERMEAVERAVLATLGVPDPYADDATEAPC